jgi:hypothetical protein
VSHQNCCELTDFKLESISSGAAPSWVDRLNSPGTHVVIMVLSLAFEGVCFVLYPTIRTLSEESTLRGVEAFSTSSWLLVHSLAMVGFFLLTLEFLGLQSLLHEATAESLGITALVATWTVVSLVLPFYGAETFTLHAVGLEAC